jgi:Uma2 family endonuclease
MKKSVKDQREKLALYEHFEVKEYWIIDPANYTVALYSLRSTGGAGYGKPELFGPGD